MSNQSKTQKIEELANSILDRWSMFLVDIEIQGGREPVIWLYVDAEERDVGLDECAEVSQELGFLIDAYEVFDKSYRLNVSTPGTDRPLMDQRQYRKNCGRKARIKFEQNGTTEHLEARILKVYDSQLELQDTKGKKHSISFSDIIETVIIPEINK